MNDHKGPWTLHEGMTHMSVRNSETDTIFSELKNIPGVREDARLIAAAPCMYEALKTIVSGGWIEHSKELQDQAKAALKKAEGGE